MENVSGKRILKFALPVKTLLSIADGNQSEEYLLHESIYCSKGNLVREKKFFDDGDVEEIHDYSYNDNNALIKHVVAIPQDNIEECFITERNVNQNPLKVTKFYGDEKGEETIYSYNVNHLPIAIASYDADGVIESEELIEYNTNNQILSRTITNHYNSEASKKMFFEYNDNVLTRVNECNLEGTLETYYLYSYDADGREIGLQQFQANDKRIAHVVSNYDEDGLLLSKVSSGFHVRVSEYSYDENGRLTEETLSDENNFVIHRYRYVYNPNGELIEETQYEADLLRTGRDLHQVLRYQYENIQ